MVRPVRSGANSRVPWWQKRGRVVTSVVVHVEAPSLCATCGEGLEAGARARRDEWRKPVFERQLVSLICTPCVDEGL